MAISLGDAKRYDENSRISCIHQGRLRYVSWEIVLKCSGNMDGDVQVMR